MDKDSRVRRLAGLPIPSLEELRALKGIKVIRGSECKENLQRLGVLPQMRRLTSEKNRWDRLTVLLYVGQEYEVAIELNN